MTLTEVVKDIIEREHMGPLADLPNVQALWRGVNTLRIRWVATIDNKQIPQYAEFKFTNICLDAHDHAYDEGRDWCSICGEKKDEANDVTR